MASSPAHAANIVPQLPLKRYRLRFRGGDGAALEGRYLGSAWRGAFGHALRRSACITNLPRCDDCALLEHRVYPRTFEKRTPADAQKLRLYPTTPNPLCARSVARPRRRGYDALTAMRNALAHGTRPRWPAIEAALKDPRKLREELRTALQRFFG